MKATADDGRPLDAEFSVEKGSAGLAVVFESRGERTRNRDYNSTLELVLTRLSVLGGVLSDVLVESRATQALSPEERRVPLQYPVHLQFVSDIQELREQIGRGQATVGRQPGAKGAGKLDEANPADDRIRRGSASPLCRGVGDGAFRTALPCPPAS